jgi:diguanylate cyclase
VGLRAARGWSVSCSLALGSLGWTLVSEQPALAAFRPLVLLPPLLLGSGLALALFFWALSARVASGLARPLRELYAGLAAAARGDLSVELPEGRARGEVESLVVNFNTTLRRLREKTREIEISRRALEEQNAAFQQQYEAASKLSVTDTLTRLHNRRFFQEQLEREIRRLSRHGKGLSLLLIDIDDFKKLNDTYGHAAGDEFLKQIATILKEGIRATDVVARYGGEEFVVVATGTGIEGAAVLAEKLRTAIAEASFIVDDSMRPRRATVSIGVAEYKGGRTEMFNAADAALYRAKRAGKNCVMTGADGAE